MTDTPQPDGRQLAPVLTDDDAIVDAIRGPLVARGIQTAVVFGDALRDPELEESDALRLWLGAELPPDPAALEFELFTLVGREVQAFDDRALRLRRDELLRTGRAVLDEQGRWNDMRHSDA